MVFWKKGMNIEPEENEKAYKQTLVIKYQTINFKACTYQHI